MAYVTCRANVHPIGSENCLSKSVDTLYTSDEKRHYVENLSLVKARSLGKDYAGPFKDILTISDAFAPLVPVYKAFKEGVLSQQPEGVETIQEWQRLRRLTAFFETFGLTKHKIPMYTIESVDTTSLTSEAEAYYNLLDAKNKARFYDLIEEKVEGSDNEVRYKRCQSGAEVSFSFSQLLDNGELVAVMDCILPYGWQYIYKDASITANALRTYLNSIETALTAYQAFVASIGEKVARWNIHYSNLGEDSDSNLKSKLLTGYDSFGAKLHSKFLVVGTDSDFDALDEVCNKLNILIMPTQRLEVSADDVAGQQSSVIMNRINMSANSEATAKDYGCLMYLSWLAFSDIYMLNWRGFAGMRDWLRFVGVDNVVDTLKRIDTYAVVDTGMDTILITSGGFLRLTQGTVENPEVVEWIDLETVVMLCGIDGNETRMQSAYLSALSHCEVESVDGEYDEGYVTAVKTLSYLYNKCYTSEEEFATYETGWMNLFKAHYDELGIDPKKLSYPESDDWGRRGEKYKAFKQEYTNFYYIISDLKDMLRSRVNTSSFAGSTFGAGTESSRRRGGFAGREISTMRKIIYILHQICHSDNLTVKVCETSLGRKTAPSFVDFKSMGASKYRRELPKHKDAITEKYKEKLKKAWEADLAKELDKLDEDNQ